MRKYGPESLRSAASLPELLFRFGGAVTELALREKSGNLQEKKRVQELGPAGRSFENIYRAVDFYRMRNGFNTNQTIRSRLTYGSAEHSAVTGIFLANLGIKAIDKVIYSVHDFPDGEQAADVAQRADSIMIEALNNDRPVGALTISKEYLGQQSTDVQFGVETATRQTFEEAQYLFCNGRPLSD
jgi:hypothetical protein